MTVPATFYISNALTCNILSESLVYELEYIPKEAFQEKFLDHYFDQEDFIHQAGPRMFGSDAIAESVVSSTKLTKGNLNSGEKRRKVEKLKDKCANTQVWIDGKLRCKCKKRTGDLPPIDAIEGILFKVKVKYQIADGAQHWPAKAEEEVLEMYFIT